MCPRIQHYGTVAPKVMNCKQEWSRLIANSYKNWPCQTFRVQDTSRCISQCERLVPGASWPGFPTVPHVTGERRLTDLLLDCSEMKSSFGHHFKPTYGLTFFFFPHKSPLTHFPPSSNNHYLHYIKWDQVINFCAVKVVFLIICYVMITFAF